MNNEAVRQRVADALLDLAPLFAHHKLTLVARDLRENEADVVVTNDDDLPAVSEVLTALNRMEKR